MDELAQAELVRSFMLQIAPEITRWTLGNSENPDPASNSRMVLEWSVYLSSEFTALYNTLHAPENAPQTTDPIKAKLETAATIQRETFTPTAPVQQTGTGLPPGTPRLSGLR